MMSNTGSSAAGLQVTSHYVSLCVDGWRKTMWGAKHTAAKPATLKWRSDADSQSVDRIVIKNTEQRQTSTLCSLLQSETQHKLYNCVLYNMSCQSNGEDIWSSHRFKNSRNKDKRMKAWIKRVRTSTGECNYWIKVLGAWPTWLTVTTTRPLLLHFW